MTSKEIAETMLEKAKNSKGILFVQADDWVWTFQDGKLIMSGHSIRTDDLLNILRIKHTCLEFEDNDAAEEFSNLV